jgi:GAF domain-containing protein
MATTQAEVIADLQRTNAELRRERDVALALNRAYAARSIASIDVMKTIADSPDDTQPVFELIARHVGALCGASSAAISEYDGTLMYMRAWTGYDPAAAAAIERTYPRVPSPDFFHGRTVLSGGIIQIRDVMAEPDFWQAGRDLGVQSMMGVPLLRDGRVIGVIGLSKQETGGFDDTQVALTLIETFAEQASLAIAGAATLRELRQRTSDLQESLEYQTATSDVLNVLSRSTFDLQPVLDALVETAAQLCNAEMVAIVCPEGGLWRLAAHFGFPPKFEAYQRARGAYPLDPSSPTVLARAVGERRAVHIHDVAAVPGYPDALITLGKQRSSLGVPLLREGATIGVIVLARLRVEPFADRQIDLVSTFADQAVIAMENTRLLTEQREALEQQTATAEVLQVINASPGNLPPVFDAILEKAHSLCGATIGTLQIYDDDQVRVVAIRGAPDELVTILRPGWRRPVNPAIPFDQVSQIADSVEVLARSGDPVLRAIVEIGQVRTQLHVPLIKEGVAIGRIAAAVRKFGCSQKKKSPCWKTSRRRR